MWETGEDLTRELEYFSNSLTIYNEWGIGYVAWVWTIPAHMRWGLLQNEGSWLPPPNEAGEILVNKIAETPPPQKGGLSLSVLLVSAVILCLLLVVGLVGGEKR